MATQKPPGQSQADATQALRNQLAVLFQGASGQQILAQLLGSTPAQGLAPARPPHIQVWDAKTGKALVLHRIDADEQLMLGYVVDHPSKAGQVLPEELERAEEAEQAGEASDLETMDTTKLRALWEELYGEKPHPQLGRPRLIEEIVAKRSETKSQEN